MQWNIENIVRIIIKHLQMNQILALNNPYWYAIKQTNLNQTW